MECCITHNDIKEASWHLRVRKALAQKIIGFLNSFTIEGAEHMSKIK